MPRSSIALSILFVAVTACSAHAGNNHGARAWLSWDRPGIKAAWTGALTDSAMVYCQLQGASDIARIAIGLEYEATDQSHRFDVVDASPSQQYGWVARGLGAGTVFGDSTYEWIANYPPSGVRTRVGFKVSVSPGDTANGSAWLTEVILQDSAGLLDTATVIGGATV